MPEEKESETHLLETLNGLKKDIVNLNDKIEQLEKQSRSGAEDQIFLGAVLAFITVFLTLQFTDVSTFFQSVNSPTAVYSAVTLEVSGITFLGMAIGLRYWATLVDDSQIGAIAVGRFCFWYNSSVLRYLSLESLITGLVLAIVIVTLNIILIVPFLLVQTLLSFFVVVIIISSGWFENKILQVYKNKKLIPDDSAPFARTVFSATAFFVSGVAFLFAIINLLIALLGSTQLLNPLTYNNSGTSILIPFQRGLSALTFLAGAILFYKMTVRHYYINSPTKEIRSKFQRKRKIKKLFKFLVKRARQRCNTMA